MTPLHSVSPKKARKRGKREAKFCPRLKPKWEMWKWEGKNLSLRSAALSAMTKFFILSLPYPWGGLASSTVSQDRFHSSKVITSSAFVNNGVVAGWERERGAILFTLRESPEIRPVRFFLPLSLRGQEEFSSGLDALFLCQRQQHQETGASPLKNTHILPRRPRINKHPEPSEGW